jgi:seryl-tRNA synthetase
MVKDKAYNMAKSVAEEAERKSELASTKYFLEMANIHPVANDGSEESQEKDNLARTLMRALNLPEEPISRKDDEENTVVIQARGGDAGRSRDDDANDDEVDDDDAHGSGPEDEEGRNPTDDVPGSDDESNPVE